MLRAHPPTWLRILVRIDFVLAVLLTVIAPLALLMRAVRSHQQEFVQTMLSYWRASSLLMIAVYLLIGERQAAFVCGVAARVLIPLSIFRADVQDRWFVRWRRVLNVYCALGAAINVPTLHPARFSALRRAYIEPAQEFGDLLHPNSARDVLGRLGERGLIVYVGGALVLAARNLWRYSR